MNKQHSKPPKRNCITKTDCLFCGKCQYETVVYKVELYCDHDAINNNNKKVYLLKMFLKKYFIIINVVSPMRHIRIVPIYRNIFGRSKQS